MNTTKTQPEESKRKKRTIMLIITIFIVFILGCITYTLIMKNLPDPHFKGDATKEEIKKFNSLKNQFDLVAKFAIEKNNELHGGEPDDGWGGYTYNLDVVKGQITHQMRSKSEMKNFDYIPFESDESIKIAIKDLYEYFVGFENEKTPKPDVRVLGEKVTFIYMGERTIYSTAGVPTYTDCFREDGGNYKAYKLADNWYFLK